MNAAPADYSNRDFRGEDMHGVDLRGANLSGANLVGSHGLAARKLLGADRTGARLPENIKKFEALKGVDNATKGAGRVWTTTMLACLYCWLLIATTTDAAFFGAEQQTALPFIQTKMSMPASCIIRWLRTSESLFLRHAWQPCDGFGGIRQNCS